MHRFELWGCPITSDLPKEEVIDKHFLKISEVRLKLSKRRVILGRIEIKNGVVTAFSPEGPLHEKRTASVLL